jgi:hypothetical protein
MPYPRPLRELTDVDDPAWPSLSERLRTARVQVLPTDRTTAARTLFRLQMTTRSTLGALTFHTGGVVFDHGWLRVLGSGGPYDQNGSPALGLPAVGLPSIAHVNHLPLDPSTNPRRHSLTVGYDILGGSYVLNTGDLPADPGEICYFAPDELDGRPLGLDQREFVDWAIQGGLTTFYQDQRWPGWEEEASRTPLDAGIALFPSHWGEGVDTLVTGRRQVPFVELLNLQVGYRGTLHPPIQNPRQGTA